MIAGLLGCFPVLWVAARGPVRFSMVATGSKVGTSIVKPQPVYCLSILLATLTPLRPLTYLAMPR